MNIELLAAGTRPPAWVNEGFGEYQKRLSREWPLNLREVPIAKRMKNSAIEKLKNDESTRMLAMVRPSALVVALDRTGISMSTEQLARSMERWGTEYGQLQFLIGGPDGLSEACTDAAGRLWSLSPLTFPHFMVRILVAEQLYRAWSILHNHPYHK